MAHSGTHVRVMAAMRRMVPGASGRRTPGRGSGQDVRCHRHGAIQRPAWTVPRWHGCGRASSPAARSRGSAGAARRRPTAAARRVGHRRPAGPGRSRRGRRAAGRAASRALATVWASSSKRAARSRSPRSPARSSPVDLRDLAAQGGDLDSQGGQALAKSPGGRFSLRAGHRLPRPGWVVRRFLGQDELVLGVEADVHQARAQQRQQPGRERDDPAPRCPAHPDRPASSPQHAMGDRGTGQAERAADRRRRIPGCIGGQDRLVAVPPRGLLPAGLQWAAFLFGHAAPDAVRDPVAEGVLRAQRPDRARYADLPRELGRLAALREEQLKVSAAARSPLPPARDETRRSSQGAVPRQTAVTVRTR